MQEITTYRLRQIIKDEILDAIRNFRQPRGEHKGIVKESVSDYEVETFILTNPYFGETLATQLIDQDFAGFHPSAEIYEYGEEGFVELVRKWAANNEWLQSVR